MKRETEQEEMEQKRLSDDLWKVTKILPTDYASYGGEVQRWEGESEEGDADCSCACRHFRPLEELPYDWGVCSNPKAPRAGLLTWEHMAGRGCFEMGDVND